YPLERLSESHQQRWWYFITTYRSPLGGLLESHQQRWWYFITTHRSPLGGLLESHQQRWWYFITTYRSPLERLLESHQQRWWYFIPLLPSQLAHKVYQRIRFLLINFVAERRHGAGHVAPVHDRIEDSFVANVVLPFRVGQVARVVKLSF